ncbi:MAG: hypothetical protein KF843_02280 [Flavobacteriales bacterium]|nr:hypothetical protein [Flavobacteriales bacterium]
MDLKSLKLELLERISLLEDEVRLLALKRLLDAPRGYGIPNDHLTVVKEGEEPYLKLEDRNYSAEEVRQIVEDILQARRNENAFASSLSPEEWGALDREGEEAERGQGTFHTVEEVMAHLRKDLEK